MTRVLQILAIVALAATAQPAAAKTVLETATDTEAFSVLLTAIKAAGLTEMLSDSGPYTLFAPSDDAFGKLPKATYESLFKLENKQKLKDILLHHVVFGTVLSRDVIGKRMEAQPMFGDSLLIDATRNVMIDSARATQTDIRADNGVMYVIDTVLLPK